MEDTAMKDDPELAAMSTIRTALDALDEPTRERILRWARDRYGASKSAAPREPVSVHGSWRGDTLPRQQALTNFSDVADIYAAANPSTDAEKVLVVGYWFHTVRAETELDSFAINTELKNLGYPIGNVTRAVTALASMVPRLVVQTKKSGTTKQARKKFKLTVEGMKRVEQMLGGTSLRVARSGGDEHVANESED
jgi:hypothetical protein